MKSTFQIMVIFRSNQSFVVQYAAHPNVLWTKLDMYAYVHNLARQVIVTVPPDPDYTVNGQLSMAKLFDHITETSYFYV